MPHLVWASNEDEQGTYFQNQRWTEYTGIAGPELLGNGWLQCLYPDDLEHVWTTWNESVALGRPFEAEYRLRRHDGQYRWHLAKAMPLADVVPGQPVRWYGTTTDIHDARSAQEALRLNESRLTIALDAAELGTLEYSPNSDKLTVAPRTLAILGFPQDALISMDDVLNIVVPSARERVRGALAAALDPSSNGIFNEEYDVASPVDGRLRSIRAQGRCFFAADGSPQRFIGLVIDITLQKETERELALRVDERTAALRMANEQLERSNRELEQYAYIASHDLQEPLRKIRTFTDMLLSRYSATDMDARSMELLSKTKSSAERMSGLIADLLNYSRLINTEEEKMPVDLCPIIEQIIVDFELTIAQKNASFKIGSLPVIIGAPLQINQLFYNLLNNALKFVKEDVSPLIKISSRVATLEDLFRLDESVHQNRPYMVISVSDNGIGFSSQYSDQIFEIFKRLHSKQSYSGTGIGLALVRKIVLQHEGSVWAEGEEGRGASFHMLLPVATVNA